MAENQEEKKTTKTASNAKKTSSTKTSSTKSAATKKSAVKKPAVKKPAIKSEVPKSDESKVIAPKLDAMLEVKTDDNPTATPEVDAAKPVALTASVAEDAAAPAEPTVPSQQTSPTVVPTSATVSADKANNIQVVDPTKALKDAAAVGNIPGLKVRKEMNPEKKKKLTRALIASLSSLVVILLVVILWIAGVFSPNLPGFGDTKSLATMQGYITGSGSSLELNTEAFNNIAVTQASGVIYKAGDGEVAEVGKQASFNYKLYANVSDEMMQGKSGGEPHWQVVQSSWDSEQSYPVQIQAKTSDDSSLSSALGGTSGSSAQNDPTTEYFNSLLIDQKIGMVFGLYMVGQASAQGSSPDMFVLGELDYVGEEGSTPDAPNVSTDVPANAPVINFDGSGAPTGINVSDDFKNDKTSDIVVKVLQEGTGAVVKNTDTVSAKYAGWLLDGTQFDSSFTRGAAPAEFSLSSVIKGWTYGLSGQKIGSKVELLVPSKYGYGANGSSPKIPGDSYLVFYVEIVDAKAATASSADATAPETEQMQ